MIAFELPDDVGPTRDQIRRDPPRERVVPAAVAEARRRIRVASAVSLYLRGHPAREVRRRTGVDEATVWRAARRARP